MYLLEFVNLVRTAQGAAPLDALPADDDPGFSPLEVAMGARLEPGLMRFSSLDAAHAVSSASGLPLGIDGVTVALPTALAGAVPDHAEGPVGYPVSAETPDHDRTHRDAAAG